MIGTYSIVSTVGLHVYVGKLALCWHTFPALRASTRQNSKEHRSLAQVNTQHSKLWIGLNLHIHGENNHVSSSTVEYYAGQAAGPAFLPGRAACYCGVKGTQGRLNTSRAGDDTAANPHLFLQALLHTFINIVWL